MDEDRRERHRVDRDAQDGAWREALERVGRRDEAEGRRRLPDAGVLYARAAAQASEGEAGEGSGMRTTPTDASYGAAARRALRPVRWMEWIGAAAAAVAIVLALRWAMREEVADRLLGSLAEGAAFQALLDAVGGVGEAAGAMGGGAGPTWPPPVAWTPPTMVVVGASIAVLVVLVTALVSPDPREL